MEATPTWITMPDGVRLAVDLYRPAGPGPFAALLEALPYRKDDLTSASHTEEYRRLVGEGGFAVCRADLRGTGSSEGVATDEYPPSEQRDLAEVIAWLAGQPWSNGRVGMFGTSYSGFNSLQMACERPPALDAICAIYATDDRYTDDVHFMGGALRAVDLVDYCHYMTPMNALPPVPAVFGAGWREEWRRRIDANPPWVLEWLRQQLDGPYWRHGSLRPGYDRIRCATMIVAGWADGYRNNTFRTFEALHCPKSMLIGPWSHMSTASSLPGPHIDLVPEMIRWFGRWLRDDDNGVDTEPPIRLFVRHATVPEPDLPQHRGVWRAEPGWPLERARVDVLRPEPPSGRDVLAVRADTGMQAWISCAGSLPWGQSLDQRADDTWSLTYDWLVEDAELEIVGHALVHVDVASSAAVAGLSAKLEDVFPDGTSALVTRGYRNLTHRASSTEPQPLPVGEPVTVAVELEAAAYRFPVGHRIRLAMTGADWPNVWPAPGPVELQVERASLRLELPVISGPAPIPEAPTFLMAPAEPDSGAGEAQPPTVWRFEHDVLARESRAVVDHGAVHLGPHGVRVVEAYRGRVTVSVLDPAVAAADATTTFEVAWPEVTCLATARMTIRSDATAFHVIIDLETTEDGEPFAARRWEESIPRLLG